MTPNIKAARDALAHIELDEVPVSLRAKSRDFFWYSPVLKARLDHVTGDFAVAPRNEAEVAEVLAACFAHDCPVTVRGAGTGNYGQAMPLAGGCILHTKNLNRVTAIHPGRVVSEPGALLREVDEAANATGQELRMFSSTWATATIGGFVAGGSGGVGSVRWGFLRDLGNIVRLRVATMEAAPRFLDFTGEELARVSHAYGTNGVITEVEMPLAPAHDWTDVVATFDDFMDAARFADDLAHEDGILIKLATPVEAPLPHDWFPRLRSAIPRGRSVCLLMIAPQAMDAFLTFAARRKGAEIVCRSDTFRGERGPGKIFEYAWNHTTLRGLKVDPAITYLQVRYAAPDHLATVAAIRRRFGEEVPQHLEAVRMAGLPQFAGLPAVRFTSEERLDEIVRIHEDMGAHVFNPHRYTLEEGGRQSVDAVQLAFKREADPRGLLNPGKMIAWDRPDWDYARMYAYAGMRPPP